MRRCLALPLLLGAACVDPGQVPATADAPGSWIDGGPTVDTERNCVESTIGLSETQVVFAAPAGAQILYVKAWGAGGNHEGGCDAEGYDDGGVGGFTEAVFNVEPGDPLIVIVGRNGRSDPTGDLMRFGFGRWGGGGLSGVFRGAELIDESDGDRALLIAGGGGSAGDPGDGCFRGGNGNAPDAGGMPTMQGGEGADGYNGGAGGYRGGVGGEHRRQSRGGSGYVAGEALDSRMLWSSATEDVPPETDDVVYNGTAGVNEADGLVVLAFVCSLPGPL